ncbi:VWA domain-containing protein [Bacillus sp. FJAT-49736]|uniref:vWA domain-containing protein n=1 Tax=Bacillus sp. FJAT-49736 TaxID=2833582 RepID=UPI001BC95E30|nr:VWA domain-containing protein [Bacillus sp. FJAT-49736]MBS4173717.1 VWA domain-containing protein [Bacillus sp. FJAT-49736]
MLRKAIFVVTFLFVLFLPFQLHRISAATSGPYIDFSVQPSAKEYIKPVNSDAEGRLDISITPKGMATNEQRQPIEVYFVHDTSGSMADNFNGAMKATSAENALSTAVDFFSNNSQSNDSYHFIPFDSDISRKVIYSRYGNVVIQPSEGLANIKSIVPYLDSASNGGTNYTQPLQSILDQTSPVTKTKKYVILLTDGEPTILKKTELVSDNSYKTPYYTTVNYELYTNHTAKRFYNNKKGSSVVLDTNYTRIQSTINSEALNTADSLGANKITMYSIAFAKPGDVNYQLLDSMAKKTGGFAAQGNTNSLTSLFTGITSQFDAPAINGEVTVDLSKFNGKVKVKDGANAFVDSNNIAHIIFNFSYPINSNPSPNGINVSLPLTFSQEGTYTFDDINLSYTDLNGKQVEKKHVPVTVDVKKDVAPTFSSAVELVGNQFFPPESLVKLGSTNTERNQFFVKYTLNPTGLLNLTASGTISGMKIYQPLPVGITLVNSQVNILSGASILTGATAQEINQNGQRVVQITIPKSITYALGSFSTNEFSFSINLQANWAMSYTAMPIANLQYNDSRFGSQQLSLSASTGMVGMKVHIDGSDYSFIGDYGGKVQKVVSNTQAVIAETDQKTPNISNKPIMGMDLKNNNQTIEITYSDNTKGYIYLKTDFQMSETATGKILPDGSSTSGSAQFNITNLVAGKNVAYEYKIISDTGTTNWTSFNPSDTIPIPANFYGNVEVDVRTTGGFTSDPEAVKKFIFINKKITSITVTPNPIEVNVGTSVNFTVTIVPNDALNMNLNMSISNSNASINGNSILGVREGTAKLIINSTDGSNIHVEVPIIVKNPYVKLLDMRFTKAKYTLLLGDNIPILPNILFTPDNATNKWLRDVTSSSNSVIQIVKKADGTWWLQANKLGYSTIKIISDDNPAITDTAVFEVVQPNNGGGGSTDDSDGKW